MDLMASEGNPAKEKHIVIDPISLRDWVDKVDAPDLLPTPKFKFTSTTLTNSPISAERFNAPATANSKAPALLKSDCSTNQECAERSLVALRSTSCGPCDDMARWLNTPHTGELGNKKCMSKIEEIWVESPNAAELRNKSTSTMEKETKYKETAPDENQFKCGALCLFLPALGKGKPVQAKNEDSVLDNVSVISKRVSFEKFECGSWASSTIENSGSLYFDLPLELIRNSADVHAPDNSAFMFNKDPKGVLNQ